MNDHTTQGDTSVRRHAEATAKRSAHAAESTAAASAGTTRARRGLFGLVCLCVLGLTAFLGSGAPSAGADQACANEALRAEQHATALPDCRAYELVSPAGEGKLGSDVMADSMRTRAAAAESPGLPMAATFSSLGGFGDPLGTGVGVDYLAQRDAAPGTSGWDTHAITPAQQPLTFGAVSAGMDPVYQGDFSPDLSRGIFRSWSPVPTADGPHPNVEEVENLYLRDDLRSPGAGSYGLLTDSAGPQASIESGAEQPKLAGASADMRHVLFESELNLTADASGSNTKLYRSDEGAVHLLEPGIEGCPGGSDAASPCSMAGAGASGHIVISRAISTDGSRVSGLTSPTANKRGIVSRLFQIDDSGTPADPADDATIQLSSSEKATPDYTEPAEYQTASVDGSRVFFTSPEQLTEESGSGLYMWERQDTNETQQLRVDAEGGTFTLTARLQPSVGEGRLANGSNKVQRIKSGSFAVGQTVEGPGIQPGTTVTEVDTFANAVTKANIFLSKTATANDSAARIEASVQATTGPLSWRATAREVQEALEGLTVPGYPSLPAFGEGNVEVTGGPGDNSATHPYDITFTGALAGVDVPQMSADGSGLAGGGESATVSTTSDVHNLVLIGPGALGGVTTASGTGVLGASERGDRVYFISNQQLVSGAPPLAQRGIFYWQDAEGPPAGTLSLVGPVRSGDATTNVLGQSWLTRPQTARLTPDGKSLIFEVSDGAELAPGYEHGRCDGGNANRLGNGLCSEIYLYRAGGSTPTEPDLVCASCDLANPAASGHTYINIREGTAAASSDARFPRALTDDGQRVFFTTNEALVPGDTNGAYDAYEYDVASGEVHLLSSGTDPSDSYFMDTSADGSDAFFVTRQRLLGWDIDQSYDLYDARTGGGFPEPPVSAACEGESCRAAAAAPVATSAGSLGLRGPGNAKPHRKARCGKGKRRVKRHGRARCVKRRHRKHGRRRGHKRHHKRKHSRANADRRMSR
jgi:hypothetical protein